MLKGLLLKSFSEKVRLVIVTSYLLPSSDFIPLCLFSWGHLCFIFLKNIPLGSLVTLNTWSFPCYCLYFIARIEIPNMHGLSDILGSFLHSQHHVHVTLQVLLWSFCPFTVCISIAGFVQPKRCLFFADDWSLALIPLSLSWMRKNLYEKIISIWKCLEKSKF